MMAAKALMDGGLVSAGQHVTFTCPRAQVRVLSPPSGLAVSWAPLCQLTPLFPRAWGLCAWHLWPQCLWGVPVCLTYTVPSPSEAHVDLMTERVVGTCHHFHPLLSTWRLCWGRAWQRKGSTAWSLPFPLVRFAWEGQ